MRELHLEPERGEAVLRRLLDRQSNCIDIGAHIGSVLSDILRLSPKGTHVAIEPVSTKADWLRRKFPEVEVHALALGEEAEEADFQENLSRPGYSRLGGDVNARDRVRQRRVRVRPLDEVIPLARPVHFIKIDVEGAELSALRGAKKILARWRPPIMFESGPDGAAAFGYHRRQLFDFLNKDQGYEIFHFQDFLDGGEPLSWCDFDACHEYPARARNFIAIRADRPVQDQALLR
ncbi:MAG: FkbM family methyltransferase [bacterium]|nr:FkbM family methyltransferase [bacterium]